jgi:hypothetical protein
MEFNEPLETLASGEVRIAQITRVAQWKCQGPTEALDQSLVGEVVRKLGLALVVEPLALQRLRA